MVNPNNSDPSFWSYDTRKNFEQSELFAEASEFSLQQGSLAIAQDFPLESQIAYHPSPGGGPSPTRRALPVQRLVGVLDSGGGAQITPYVRSPIFRSQNNPLRESFGDMEREPRPVGGLPSSQLFPPLPASLVPPSSGGKSAAIFDDRVQQQVVPEDMFGRLSPNTERVLSKLGSALPPISSSNRPERLAPPSQALDFTPGLETVSEFALSSLEALRQGEDTVDMEESEEASSQRPRKRQRVVWSKQGSCSVWSKDELKLLVDAQFDFLTAKELKSDPKYSLLNKFSSKDRRNKISSLRRAHKNCTTSCTRDLPSSSLCQMIQLMPRKGVSTSKKTVKGARRMRWTEEQEELLIKAQYARMGHSEMRLDKEYQSIHSFSNKQLNAKITSLRNQHIKCSDERCVRDMRERCVKIRKMPYKPGRKKDGRILNKEVSSKGLWGEREVALLLEAYSSGKTLTETLKDSRFHLLSRFSITTLRGKMSSLRKKHEKCAKGHCSGDLSVVLCEKVRTTEKKKVPIKGRGVKRKKSLSWNKEMTKLLVDATYEGLSTHKISLDDRYKLLHGLSSEQLSSKRNSLRSSHQPCSDERCLAAVNKALCHRIRAMPYSLNGHRFT